MSQGNSIVPEDFPTPAPTPFALGGVQLKMNLTRAADGRLHASGSDPDVRLRRYRDCVEEVEWAVDLLQGKLLKPKYHALEREVILKSLGGSLVRDRGLSPREAEWVLQNVAPRLDWPR